MDTFTRLKTPLGPLHVDKDIIADLKSQSGFVKISGADSEMEHSIEMQLPILKHILEKLAVPCIALTMRLQSWNT